MRVLTRAVALVAVLIITASGWAECAGWQATPEARMACCEDGAACPMHASPTSGSDSTVSQTEADRCCAASESADPTPASPVFAMLLPAAAPVPQLFVHVLPLILSVDAAREPVPLAGQLVPTHLFLSVFLI